MRDYTEKTSTNLPEEITEVSLCISNYPWCLIIIYVPFQSIEYKQMRFIESYENIFIYKEK